jgi:hypothetical protein
MNMHRNKLLTGTPITERAHCAKSFIAATRALTDRHPFTGRSDHGLVLPEAGDLIA